MKSILQFTADGAAGGGTTVVLSLVEDLLARGWRVTVLTEGPPYDFPKLIESNPQSQSEVERGHYAARRAAALGAEVVTGDFMGSRTNPSLTKLVTDTVARVKPDVVHLHGTRAMYFGRQLKHPAVVATIHGYHHLRKGLFGRTIGAIGVKQSFGAIKDMIFVSDYDRKSGGDHGLIPRNAEVHVIHNGIRVPEVILGPRELRRIAFPHRLTYPKDPIAAIHCLQLLPGYSMEIAGDGELMDAASSYVKEVPSLKLHGGLSREDTLRLIGESGVMLMTSKWEGLPMTPLESMALGTPVVAPAVCGIPEIIEDGVDGILVREHIPEAYANAIQRLENSALWQDISEKGKAKVERQFTWERCFQRHLEIYEARSAR